MVAAPSTITVRHPDTFPTVLAPTSNARGVASDAAGAPGHTGPVMETVMLEDAVGVGEVGAGGGGAWTFWIVMRACASCEGRGGVRQGMAGSLCRGPRARPCEVRHEMAGAPCVWWVTLDPAHRTDWHPSVY